MQLKLSLISRTNQMSHPQWRTFRDDLGVFKNIKVPLSGDASKAGTHKPQWNFFLPAQMHQRACVVPVLNWSSKNQSYISPLGFAGPLWRRNRGVILGRTDRHLTVKRAKSGPCLHKGLFRCTHCHGCINKFSLGVNRCTETRNVFSFVYKGRNQL